MSAKLGRSYLCAQLPFTKEKYSSNVNWDQKLAYVSVVVPNPLFLRYISVINGWMININ